MNNMLFLKRFLLSFMTDFTKLYCIKDFTNFLLRTKKDHVNLVILECFGGNAEV